MTNIYYIPLTNTDHDVTTPVGLVLTSQKTYNDLSVLKDIKHPVALNACEVQSIPSLLTYMHICEGFPVSDTCIEAITKVFYDTWPVLTPERVWKYLPKSEEAEMRQMNLVRQVIHSTEWLIEYGIWYPLEWKWKNSNTKLNQTKQADSLLITEFGTVVFISCLIMTPILSKQL